MRRHQLPNAAVSTPATTPSAAEIASRVRRWRQSQRSSHRVHVGRFILVVHVAVISEERQAKAALRANYGRITAGWLLKPPCSLTSAHSQSGAGRLEYVVERSVSCGEGGAVSKYNPLRDYLAARPSEQREITMSFGEIENLL